jgi:hypothetical protein
MATARPFSYNIGAPITGTDQVGGLAVGTPTAGFASTGLPWWNGPDEEEGYVIAQSVPGNTQPVPVGTGATGASVGFFRSSALTDPSFISIANAVAGPSGGGPFASGSAAKTWLNTNGYWTSYVGSTGATGGYSVNIYEYGSDVIMLGTGSFDLTDLIYIDTVSFGVFKGGLGPTTGTFVVAGGASGDRYYGASFSKVNSFGIGGTAGGNASSSTGSPSGIVTDGIGGTAYLVVPAGYTSGTVTGSSTFTGQTIASLGLTAGTYVNTWGSGANADALIMTIGGTGPAPTPPGGSGSWYFYSDEGTLNAPPPVADGNSIFIIDGTPRVETYNPNKSSGTNEIYFNLSDSAGVDYTTQFNALVTGGTLTITQGSNVARYTSLISGTFFVDSINGFFILQTGPATQTLSSASPFVSGSPITLTFS